MGSEMCIRDSNRAGEKTAYGQYSYDFAAVGIPGLKASMIYLSGGNIKTFSGAEQKDWERDFSLDYVIQSGVFKNLGLGWRNASANSEAARNQDQNRLIVSYSIPIL